MSRRASERVDAAESGVQRDRPSAAISQQAPESHHPEAKEQSMHAFANTILVAGGKGGVGKSTCASALLYCLLRAGKKPYLIETDTSNPDVAKAHQGTDATTALPMSMLDLDVEDGWLELIDTRVAHPDHVLVVSTGSRSNVGFQRFGSLLGEGLKEIDAPLVTLWMIDGNRDCLELLNQYRQVITSGPVHVLRNAHCARAFPLYESSKLRHELERSGGLSLTFPALAERVAQTLSAERLSFGAAEASETLPLGHKLALRRWLSEVSTVLQPVAV